MKTEEKIQEMLDEARRGKETWAQTFGIHSTTFETFLATLQEDVLEFELEMRRRGRNPDMTKIKRYLGNLIKGNREIRRILVNVATVEGI